MNEKPDPMPGLSSAEKKARLARMTYSDFVVKELKLDSGVLWPFQTRTHGLFGVGVDAVGQLLLSEPADGVVHRLADPSEGVHQQIGARHG